MVGLFLCSTCSQIRNRIRHEILAAYLADTAKSRIETAQGDYPRVRPPEGKCFNAQDFLIRVAEGRDSVDGIPQPAWDPEKVPIAVTPGKTAAPAKPPRRRASRKTQPTAS